MGGGAIHPIIRGVIMLGALIGMASAYSTIGGVLALAYRVLMALAINMDCRARNIGARRLFTVLAVFFPLVIGVIYAIRRKGLAKEYKICHVCGTKTRADQRRCAKCGSINMAEFEHPKRKLFATISIILCVVSVACFATSEVLDYQNQKEMIEESMQEAENGDYDEDEELFSDSDELYYDAKGIAHTYLDNMKYYTPDDKEYTYDQIRDRNDAFIGEDNLLYFLDIGELTPVDNSEFNYEYYDKDEKLVTITVEYTDKDGKHFYYADEVKWDYSCRLLPLGNY